MLQYKLKKTSDFIRRGCIIYGFMRIKTKVSNLIYIAVDNY